MVAMSATIENIERRLIPDDDPDASYLEQEGLGFEERLAAYQRGDFAFIGIRAVAELHIPTGYTSTKLKLSDIPADFEIQPIDPDDPSVIDPATCGTCGLTWDDGVCTSWTPAPSGRCPFEYDHRDEPTPTGWISQTIESPGLWGIEDDSGETYFESVYAEELGQLRDMLIELGVEDLEPIDAEIRKAEWYAADCPPIDTVERTS